MAAAPYAIVAADRPANGAADSVNSRLIKAPGELSESFFLFQKAPILLYDSKIQTS